MHATVREVIRDYASYVHATGKVDRGDLSAAIQGRGAGAILRTCFSLPEENVPARILSYFASTYHIANAYLPEAQVQMVATVHANERVNGVPADRAKKVAQRVFSYVAGLSAFRLTQPEHLVFATDRAAPGDSDLTALRKSLQDAPCVRHLERYAQGKRSAWLPYVAEHIVAHDTVQSVIPCDIPGMRNETPLTEAEQIISNGAMTEIPFYQARMLGRSAALPGLVVPKTGQFFTRNALPPYTFRGQSPSIVDPELEFHTELWGNPLSIEDHLAVAGSIARDNRYVRAFIEEAEISHEICPEADAVIVSSYMKSAAVNYWPYNVTRDGLFGLVR